MNFLLQVLLLFAATAIVHTEAESEDQKGWSSNEKKSTFVEWPEDRQSVVKQELATLQNHSQNPVVRIFTSFPESDQKVWPLFKGMATRLNPVLNPHSTFYLVDGVTYGCRTAKNDTHPETYVDTEHCHNHCIRKGRYCAPQRPDELPGGKHGRDIVQEVYRRICFIHHYHTRGSPVSYYDYLENFESKDCFSHANFTQCSFNTMDEVGAPPFNLDKCLEADKLDNDVATETLDKNLNLLGERTFREMPQVEINGVPILTDSSDGGRKDFDAGTIFSKYCDAFPTDSSDHSLKPLACRVCEPCNDVRTCLWKLTCDGTPLVASESDSDSTTTTTTSSSSSGGSSSSSGSGASSSTITTIWHGTHNDPERVTEAPHKEIATTHTDPDRPTEGPHKIIDDVSTSSSNSNSNSNSNSITSEESGEDDSNGSMTLFWVLLVLLGISCPAAFYFYRDFQNKKLRSEEADKTLAISRAGSYSDDANEDATDSTTDKSVIYRGESVRKSKRDVNEVDLVDLVLDGGNPEDMMGEESEWAENKRPTANAQIV